MDQQQPPPESNKNNKDGRRRASILKSIAAANANDGFGGPPCAGNDGNGGGNNDDTTVTNLKRRVSFHSIPKVQEFEKPSSNYSESDNPTPSATVPNTAGKRMAPGTSSGCISETTFAFMNRTEAVFDVFHQHQRQEDEVSARKTQIRAALAELRPELAATEPLHVQRQKGFAGETPLTSSNLFATRKMGYAAGTSTNAQTPNPSPAPSPLPSGFMDDTRSVFSALMPSMRTVGGPKLYGVSEAAMVSKAAMIEEMNRKMAPRAEEKAAALAEKEEGEVVEAEEELSELDTAMDWEEAEEEGSGKDNDVTIIKEPQQQDRQELRQQPLTPRQVERILMDGEQQEMDDSTLSLRLPPGSLTPSSALLESTLSSEESGALGSFTTELDLHNAQQHRNARVVEQPSQEFAAAAKPEDVHHQQNEDDNNENSQQILTPEQHSSLLMNMEQNFSTAAAVIATPTNLLKVDGIAKYGPGTGALNRTHVAQHTPFRTIGNSLEDMSNELMLDDLTQQRGLFGGASLLFGSNDESDGLTGLLPRAAAGPSFPKSSTVPQTECVDDTGEGGLTGILSPIKTAAAASFSVTHQHRQNESSSVGTANNSASTVADTTATPSSSLEIPMAHLDADQFERWHDAEMEHWERAYADALERYNAKVQEYHDEEMARLGRVEKMMERMRKFRSEQQAEDQRQKTMLRDLVNSLEKDLKIDKQQ